MKTLKIIAVGIMMLFVSSTISAQVSINVNLGLQPSWGPAGYESVNYYYLPDIQAYYDIQASQFIFLSGGNWIRSRHLPRQYRNYDLDRGYKVVLNDYHGSRPYSNFRNDRVRYYEGYRGGPQRSIGNRHEEHRNDDNHGNNKNKDHGNNKHNDRRGNNDHEND